MSHWKDDLKKLGKREFERREMERLGFWPPATIADAPQTVEALRAKIAPLNDELRDITERTRPLRLRQGEVERELSQTGNIKAHLARARQERIERVKIARQERIARRAYERRERQAADQKRRHDFLPHLGRGVSTRLHFDTPSDAEELARFQLPASNTPADLAAFLGITLAQLAWLCYHREVAPLDHYNHFSIPKRGGGTRAISAPRPYLKSAQAKILTGVLSQVEVHASAAAFLPARNIAHNAERHSHSAEGGPSVVLRIDLKDFFPSITFARVAGVFASLGYNAGISTLLALICTESPRIEATFDGRKSFVALTQRFVPQGAPTSPALTNLLCRRLDARLTGMANHYGFTYTRYADDLVFSSPQSEARVVSLQRGVFKVLESEQFTVNPDKVAIMRRGARQSVTGIVVNGDLSPRLSRHDLKRFRAVLHDIETNGAPAVSERMGKNALGYARGYLAFIHMVAPDTATRLRLKHTWLAPDENGGA